MIDLFQQAEANLQALLAWHSERIPADLNEATTRLQLIDRIFFECLGWDRGDCKAEERLEGSYKDYSFYCPQCLLIVEAKREGLCFELPSGSTTLIRQIPFFAKYNPPLDAAIRQAMTYCQMNGACGAQKPHPYL